MESHNEAYKINEENAIDSEGQIIERGDRITILLEDIEEQEIMTQRAMISTEETTLSITTLKTK